MATLICRWGGQFFSDGPIVQYSGGNSEPLPLDPDMTFKDLVNEVHSIIGSNPMNDQVNIKMKIDTKNGSQVYPCSNDRHLRTLRNAGLMEKVAQEIYVEMVPMCTQQSTMPQQQAYISSCSQTFQMSSQDITSTEYGMGPFTRMMQDDHFQMQLSAPVHRAEPVPSSYNTIMHSPMQDSRMQEVVQASPSREGAYTFENDLNNPLSLETVYTDIDDDVDGNEEEDDQPGQMVDAEPSVRTPIPWFSELPENYEVDQDWSDSGRHRPFVPGGEFEKGMYFESKEALKETVKMYSIQRNQFYTTVTSNKTVLALKCKKDCGWMIRGTKFFPSSCFMLLQV